MSLGYILLILIILTSYIKVLYFLAPRGLACKRHVLDI